MYTNCDEIFKITIPAVRIAVAKALSKRYMMNQSDIAKNLGVTQVAVSKYLSNKYSSKIAAIEKIIESKKLAEHIVNMIALNENRANVSQRIDQLASSEQLVKEALKAG